MKYGKLVRDRIPERIEAKGEQARWHVADDAEYWQKLKAKVLEEWAEFEKAESPEEFADLLEVLDAIVAYKKFDREEIARIKEAKATERGRFERRIILDES